MAALGIKGDIFGGLTAAVVALPLALAFGVASGAGPVAGLYGAIAVGFFASVFGGTPAQVSGPTGPMTVVMAGIIALYADSPAEVFTIVMLGGLFQIVFGAIGLGRFITYTPVSVVSGFMSGIGVIIILIQTLPFFGLPSAAGGSIGPIGAIRGWAGIPEAFQGGAVAVGALSLGIMIYWPRALRALVPPPLAALLLGTLAALILFPDAPFLGPIPTGLPALIRPEIPWAALPGFVQAAFILAVLGSIDSLLTSLVADSMMPAHRHRSNRELVGQGIGNFVSGLIGGLPGAGATMRTVVNIKAGGHSPLSGALHSVVLLALALGLAPLAAQVPHAALAGILVKVGWDIIDWGYLARVRLMHREDVIVMAATLALTVLVDLITAVGVGIIMANFVSARWREREELGHIRWIASADSAEDMTDLERQLMAKCAGRVVLTRLVGSFSYASAREFVGHATPDNDHAGIVIYDFSRLGHVDVSAALAIDELLEIRQNAGLVTMICGHATASDHILSRFGILNRIPQARRFATSAEALQAAITMDGGGTI
ncbi:MAG: SulP family inorganic anion transporter [Rhodobacteraceae bacterium]|nr:SulP family inorganic anion transporter [Paracoccaceae bacterium]